MDLLTYSLRGLSPQANYTDLKVIYIYIYIHIPNPSNHTMTLGSTKPLIETRPGILPGIKARPARKANNLTAICDPIDYKMWEPRRVTIL
jgi:hypothetical protein